MSESPLKLPLMRGSGDRPAVTASTGVLLRRSAATFWLVLVNVVFFWRRVSGSSVVESVLQRLGW